MSKSKDNSTHWAVVFPGPLWLSGKPFAALRLQDFPGCFSAVDDWSDLPAAVQEAVEAHFSGEPDAVPPATPLENLVSRAEYSGGVWMLVDLDLSRIDTRPVRLNVSLPSNLVQQIDAWAEAHHMTRSGFLASAATQAMAARS